MEKKNDCKKFDDLVLMNVMATLLLLKSNGYRTAMVGKWHLGMEVEGSHPIDAGFDEHLGIPSNYEPKRGGNYKPGPKESRQSK